MIWKIYPILKFESLVVFVNTLTADDKCPVPDCQNLPFPIQTQFSEKRKTFSEFFGPFVDAWSNVQYFQKKKIVIGNLFPKLQTVKYLVRPLSKKLRLRTSFESQHVNGSQTLAKTVPENCYHIFSSLGEEMIWEISPLLKFEISGVFVNTLSADGEYPVWDCEMSSFRIQRQVS